MQKKGENPRTKEMIEYVKKQKADVIVISDYSKGVVSRELAQGIIQSHSRVIVDPKKTDLTTYKGAFLIKPNKDEGEAITGKKQVEEIAKALRNQFEGHIVITLGKDGAAILTSEGEFMMLPSVAREVFDVTGAGDTFMAALALSIAAGSPLHEAVKISNVASGIKVGKVGTTTVSIEELSHTLSTLK